MIVLLIVSNEEVHDVSCLFFVIHRGGPELSTRSIKKFLTNYPKMILEDVAFFFKEMPLTS